MLGDFKDGGDMGVSLDEVLARNHSAFRDAEFVTASLSRHRMRFCQTVTCHILALGEAIGVGAVAAAALSSSTLVPGASLAFLAAAGTAVAATAFCAALANGAASFERFASRLALLPGALAAGLLTAGAAYLAGAGIPYVLVCAVTLFASVYIAKVPATLLKMWLQSSGRLSRYVAVAGDDALRRAEVISGLKRRPDVTVVYSGSSGALDVFARLAANALLDEIVLAGPCDGQLIEHISGLDVTLVQQLDTVTVAAPFLGAGAAAPFWGTPAAVISAAPLRSWRGIAKRSIDIAGSLTALILLSPVMIACAVAVKLESPGPVFFVQERQGYRNKSFRMFKFRSMRAAMTDHRGSQLTLRNDPRVTRVGAFLRRSSADELPQLFNVLMGDMSLVGPRPHPKGVKAGSTAYDDLIPNFYARYRMKPGLTGLAQISGLRGNTETEQHLLDRFACDQRYVAEWSPFLDIVIMARTVRHLLKGTNAF
jgi:exopolysaccharide biosynthesis polyprenyl glycosylphosphotransferase